MHPGGLWEGESCGKIGTFKAIKVELLQMEEIDISSNISVPEYFRELLEQLSLEHLQSRLELNGIDSLEELKRVTRKQLQSMGVEDSGEQNKLLAAACSGEFRKKLDENKESSIVSRHDSGFFSFGDQISQMDFLNSLSLSESSTSGIIHHDKEYINEFEHSWSDTQNGFKSSLLDGQTNFNDCSLLESKSWFLI